MILKKLSVVAVIALGLATFGCKSDCEKICEETMECDPEDLELSGIPVPQEDDCSDDCEEQDELTDASGCDPEWEDLVACLDGLDICDPDDVSECSSEYADLQECWIEYCEYDDIEDLPGECD
jgi:hypothetical protein